MESICISEGAELTLHSPEEGASKPRAAGLSSLPQ